MSFRALSELDHLDPPSSNVYLLLFIMAGYAGPDGSLIASQPTLAARSKLSVRCVRDNLKLAEEAGLIKMVERRRRDGSKASNTIQLTYYDPEVAPEKLTRTRPRRVSQVEADTQDVVGQAAMVAGSQPAMVAGHKRQMTTPQPAMVAGLTTFEPVSKPVESSDELSHRTCASERRSPSEGFDYIWDLYPIEGRRRSSEPASRAAVAEAITEVGFARLAVAVSAFAADPQLKRSDYGAPRLERWLAERRHIAWLPGVVAQPQPATARPVCGLPSPPVELRAAFAEAFGEAFAGSYFPVGVTADGRLVCRTPFARDRVRRDCRAWLADHNLTVIAAAEVEAERPQVSECA